MSELINIGSQSRKTGLRAKAHTRRDEYDMEDLDEFFEDEPVVTRAKTSIQARATHAAANHSGAASPAVVRTLNFARPKEGRGLPTTDTSRQTPLLLPFPSRRPLSVYSSDDLSAAQDFDMGDDTESQPMDIESEPEGPKPRALRPQQQRVQERAQQRLVQELEALDSGSSDESLVLSEPLKSLSQRSKQPAGSKQPFTSVSPSQRPHRVPPRRIVVRSELPEGVSEAHAPQLANAPDGIRRSSRRRVEPLAFWRNERIVYTGRETNGTHIQEIQDVITKPVTLPDPPKRVLGGKKRKASVPRVANPILKTSGAKWYGAGRLAAEVFEGQGSENKVMRTVAWAPNKEQYVSEGVAASSQTGENFKLAILFDENRDFAASGILTIAPGSHKGLKCVDDTYMIFHVVQGVAEVEISQQTFVAGERCSFEVPMGNFYALRNLGAEELKLFFVQTKYVVMEPQDEWS